MKLRLISLLMIAFALLFLITPVFAEDAAELDFSERFSNIFKWGNNGADSGSATDAFMSVISSLMGPAGIDFIISLSLVTAVIWFLFGLIGNFRGDSDFYQKIGIPISFIIGIATAFYLYSKGISTVGFIGPYGIVAMIGMVVFLGISSSMVLTNSDASKGSKTLVIGISLLLMGFVSAAFGVFVSVSLLAILAGIICILVGAGIMISGKFRGDFSEFKSSDKPKESKSKNEKPGESKPENTNSDEDRGTKNIVTNINLLNDIIKDACDAEKDCEDVADKFKRNKSPEEKKILNILLQRNYFADLRKCVDVSNPLIKKIINSFNIRFQNYIDARKALNKIIPKSDNKEKAERTKDLGKTFDKMMKCMESLKK